MALNVRVLKWVLDARSFDADTIRPSDDSAHVDPPPNPTRKLGENGKRYYDVITQLRPMAFIDAVRYDSYQIFFTATSCNRVTYKDKYICKYIWPYITVSHNVTVKNTGYKAYVTKPMNFLGRPCVVTS